MLTKSEVISLIRAPKREKKIGWSEIAAAAGGSEIFVTSACLGMNSLSEDASRKVVDLLGLPDEAAVVLAEYPTCCINNGVVGQK